MLQDGQVVICIVSYASQSDIVRCLDALADQTYRNFKVVVCENGGVKAFSELQDCIPGQLKNGQNVRLIADHDNPGYAGGINRCIAFEPNGAAYWILNPDTCPEQDALATLVAALGTKDLDAVGGPIHHADMTVGTCGGHWNRWLAYSRAIGRGLPVGQYPDQVEFDRRLSFISGASLLCSARFLQAAGPMREDYFLYGEEVEWCLRARRRGLKLGFCREAAILHYQGSTTGSGQVLSRQKRLPLYCDERNRILTLRDTEGGLVVLAGMIGALIVILWRYPRRGAWRAMRHALEGWLDGVLNRRGKPAWLGMPTPEQTA